LIEEGLPHAEFPAIEFRDSAAGRQAYVVGSRLAVWELLMEAEMRLRSIFGWIPTGCRKRFAMRQLLRLRFEGRSRRTGR